MVSRVVHWTALPCTATARNDASNKVRKDPVTGEMKTVFYNYRMTKDKYRRPQHSVGTQKGDDCREADRLLLAALWVMEDSGLSGVIRTPLYSHLGNKSVRKIVFYGLTFALTKS